MSSPTVARLSRINYFFRLREKIFGGTGLRASGGYERHDMAVHLVRCLAQMMAVHLVRCLAFRFPMLWDLDRIHGGLMIDFITYAYIHIR